MVLKFSAISVFLFYYCYFIIIIKLVYTVVYKLRKTNLLAYTRSSLDHLIKKQCKLTDYNIFLYELGVRWCARYK